MERKKEILDSAKKVFTIKGFAKTTMEDIISDTSLSKGGVYYYYKNKKDIIYDIFIEGNEYRMNIIKKYILDNNLKPEDFKNEDIVTDIILEKIMDDNLLMGIYAQFLVEAMYDDELFSTYKNIIENTKEIIAEKNLDEFFLNIIEKSSDFEFLTDIINTFIVGVNILKYRDNFYFKKVIIKEMIKVAIKDFKRKK